MGLTMKRTLTSILIVVGMMLAVNMQPVHAQMEEDDDAEMGNMQLGGGFAFGSEIENFGIRVDGTYDFTEQIRGAANITYYFPDDYVWGERKLFTVNANVHYQFDVESDLNVYGIGGLNLSFLSWDYASGVQGVQGADDSDSSLGLNLGGGVQYPVDFGNLFGELNYTIGDFDQLVLAAGVRFPIGG